MSEPLLPATRPDEQPIEAGEVGEIKELPFHEAQHQARRRGRWPRGWSCSSQRAWVCIICWSVSWRLVAKKKQSRTLAPSSTRGCR